MKGIKYKLVYSFVGGKNSSRDSFRGLVKASMDYKYRNYAGQKVELTYKDITTNQCMEFKEKDKIPLGRSKIIDGQKFREIFVTTIYAMYIDSLENFNGYKVKGSTIYVGYCEVDTGVDTTIIITEKSLLFEDNGLLYWGIAGKSSYQILVQVKEYFDYKEFKSDFIIPKKFDINKLNVDKLKSYDSLILIFVRSFTIIDFEEIKNDLVKAGLNGKDIILVGSRHFTEEPHEYIFWDFKNKNIFSIPMVDCSDFLEAD